MMKMALAFVLGVAVLVAGLLFCPPVRDRAEMLLFAQGNPKPNREAHLGERPLQEAADTARAALKNAFETASEAVARKGSEQETFQPDGNDTSWDAGTGALDLALLAAPPFA